MLSRLQNEIRQRLRIYYWIMVFNQRNEMNCNYCKGRLHSNDIDRRVSNKKASNKEPYRYLIQAKLIDMRLLEVITMRLFDKKGTRIELFVNDIKRRRRRKWKKWRRTEGKKKLKNKKKERAKKTKKMMKKTKKVEKKTKKNKVKEEEVKRSCFDKSLSA